MTFLIIGLVTLLAIWLLANLIYTIRNDSRLKTWEAGIERGPDGVRVGAEPFEVAEGKPALLLVHGFADSPRLWAAMCPQLEEAGFAFRAIRLPGMQEPVAQTTAIRAEDWQRAVETAFDELAQSHDVVWIVAHSLGCAITLSLLREQRIAPDGLVLHAPLIRVSSRRSPLLSSRTWHELGKGILFMPSSIESVYPVDAHDPTVRDTVYRDVFVGKNIHAALFDIIDTLPDDDASYVSCPLLQFVSKADLVVDEAAAVGFFEQVSSSRKRIVYTSEAGHVLPLDYGWESRSREMITFIGQTE